MNKEISLDFKFCCCGNSNENNWPSFENKRLLFSYNKRSVSPIFLQNLTLSENEAENLQNGDVHLAQIPNFEMEYLENHLAH